MKRTLTPTRARNVLLGVWGAFFLANIGIVLFLYVDKWIEDDTFANSLSELSSVYVTYLGIMIAFYFGGGASTSSAKKVGTPFVVAVIGSLLWNIVVTTFIAKAFLLRGDRQIIYGLEDATKQVARLGPILSWIVAPAIGFYFGNIATKKIEN